jgi:hypothetical protein
MFGSLMLSCSLAGCVLLGVPPTSVKADVPGAAYIFPAGGQRGTQVKVRIGALNLHQTGQFLFKGPGVSAEPLATKIETVWFAGPLIRQPASQRKEDYPKDYTNTIAIDPEAPLGTRVWHLANSQGVTEGKMFLVGDLPEIVEDEIDGDPIPVSAPLPITINGRIFPREDVDVWTCPLKAGEVLTCEVCAARLGSPLDSHLEVLGSDGRRLAENGDCLGLDSRVRFTAPSDGTYEIHISDANFGGLQDYVYRLTLTTGPWLDAVYPLGGQRGTTVKLEYQGVHMPKESMAVDLPLGDRDVIWHHARLNGQLTNGVPFDLDNLPEVLETEQNDKAAAFAAMPGVVNGRIGRPGEADAWRFKAKKGERWIFEVKASKLGSPLDGVLSLQDAHGKQIAEADDQSKGEIDPLLKATIPADGVYVLAIKERFASRGGAAFAYRIRCTMDTEPDFRISLPADAFTLTRGTELKIKVEAQRSGGFAEPIELMFEGLPDGVMATGTSIRKNATNAQVTLQAAETTPVALHRIRLMGRATVGEKTIERRASYISALGTNPTEDFLLAVAIPTPFKFTADFESKFSPRGSMYSRKYRLDRGGFSGPLEIRLADVQARHLQGVTAMPITLSPETNEFEFAIALPPRMEVGRTSRTCLMAVGTVTDFDGSKHEVCFSTTAQNEQMIILTDPERLGLTVRRSSIRVLPDSQIELPVEVKRGVGLKGEVLVALDLPRHVRDVAADPIRIPAASDTGTLTLKLGKHPGPFNRPLTLRAQIGDEQNRPVTAEASLEIVSDSEGEPRTQ